jgi:lipopolysaccharide/colanic/teichoic acid biosynthesis glycosyltransferase
VSTLVELSHSHQVLRIGHARSSAGEWLEIRFSQLFAAILLLLLSPVLLAIALALRMTDGAPVLFGHYRVGRHGRIFKCMKFRTMRRDAEDALAELLSADAQARLEWERHRKLTQDPRITRLGEFLRKTSLDELPQLFNVLRGEMAFVGPRPVTVEELSRYGRARWHYVSVRPGVTGLWQVSGRNRTTYEVRVALDRRYVENRSLGLDLAILLRTVWVVLTGDGAQ